ncbi:MAG: tetratricopeptide repeat protein [Polyangiaceae bacterium]
MRLIQCVPLFLLGCACTPTQAGEATRPNAPSAARALEAESRIPCDPRAELSPLVVDLPSGTRVALESAMRRGIGIVAHDCRELRVLESCRLSGDYEFAGVNRKEDVVTLKDQIELGANLPFGAASLSGRLAQGSSIQLALIQVGTRRSLFDAVGRPELRGSCDGATHFVQGSTLGAFAMQTSAQGEAKIAAEVFGVAGSAASASQRDANAKDGDLNACRRSSVDAAAPPDGCSVPVRLHLVPISEGIPVRDAKRQPKESAPVALDDQCPAGFRRVGNKCTQDASGPFLCKPGASADECRAQCNAGNAGSCYNLAVQLQQEHYAWAARGKRDGEAPRSWDQIVKDNDAKLAAYRPLFVKACDQGVPQACDRLYWIKGSNPEREAAIQRACDLDYAPSCRMAASKYFYHKETLDIDKGRKLLQRGCRLGGRDSCMGLVTSYFEPPDGSKPTNDGIRAGEAVLERVCLANDSGACWQLADLRRRGTTLTKDLGLSFAYLDRACSLSDLSACYELGEAYQTGELVGANPALAATYFDKACPLEKPDKLVSCARIGRLFREGKLVKAQAQQALVWLGRGCRYADTSSCIGLAELYERGEGTPKNVERALELYDQACQAEAPSACLAQIKLLKTRDAEKALALSRAGCKGGNFQYCDLVRDVAGAKALQSFEADCSKESPAPCLEFGKLLEKSDPARAYGVMKELCPDGSGFTQACEVVKRLARFAK